MLEGRLQGYLTRHTFVGAYLIPAPASPLTNASDERRALARARLNRPAVLAAYTELSAMDWEVYAPGNTRTPYRILPGREFRRFMSGSDIRSFDEHAKCLVAEAICQRVQSLHQKTMMCIEAARRFLPGNGFVHARAFVLERIREVIDREGPDGLLTMVAPTRGTEPDFGWSTVVDSPDPCRVPATSFDSRDRLAKGFHSFTVPSERALVRAAAYLRKMAWGVKWSPQGHWIIEPTRAFDAIRRGLGASSEDQVARCLVARAMRRLIPAATAAIRARLPSMIDFEGFGKVREDLCSKIDATIRRSGYIGMLRLAGAA